MDIRSGPEEVDEQLRRRTEATNAILDSTSRNRLIVAGPGTGKTHTFRHALDRAGGGVALTFIRNLVRDLESALGDIADVSTFHAFCKGLIHRAGGVEGLTAKFHLYPALPVLVAADIAYLLSTTVDPQDPRAYGPVTYRQATGLPDKINAGNMLTWGGLDDETCIVLERPALPVDRNETYGGQFPNGVAYGDYPGLGVWEVVLRQPVAPCFAWTDSQQLRPPYGGLPLISGG